ncbi:haloacid dehalogenase type II [Halobacillus shinanisalinarum]|uniref:Haloacid dehalogenase type II n=1 Tax=Halobacillus shinanisalinarum TaxID=2932258 RepID=A0ABY4H247_9BACI|nr:haloacid dehalogenase type II [Halobacillus shinanisalinarum]UOQ94366.1 haloacid dehalogenase type II [Halobacillus shinanisalinarum]
MSYQAYVFDAYGTLFDVHSVKDTIHNLYPEKGSSISESWRERQVHYFMIRQLIQGYQPFDTVTKWALIDALAMNDVDYSDETIQKLMDQYQHLQPYTEVSRLAENNPDKQLTIFSNGTRPMLQPLLKNNQLTNTFSLLSADDAEVYKPHPEAYQFAQNKLNQQKEEILFFSSNPWDIAGATHYGFHTAWVNRQGVKWPELGLKPTHILTDLQEIPTNN